MTSITRTGAIRAFLVRLGGLFHQERRDRDLADEIESHLQLQIEDNLRSGMDREGARRDALLKFGGIESIKEDYRDRRSLPSLESLVQDLRYGARTLRKNPGFTLVAAATLALRIGGCAAMYAYIEQLILFDNPYPTSTRWWSSRRSIHWTPGPTAASPPGPWPLSWTRAALSKTSAAIPPMASS